MFILDAKPGGDVLMREFILDELLLYVQELCSELAILIALPIFPLVYKQVIQLAGLVMVSARTDIG
jgi:hypothetical protein